MSRKANRRGCFSHLRGGLGHLGRSLFHSFVFKRPFKIIKEGDTTLFTATTDIGASLKTSNLVSDVKDILDVTSPNFAAIKEKYRSNGLRGIADADRSGEDAYDLFYAYYASKTWISDFLYRATDTTRTSNSELARLEAVEKTMWDATMVNAIASDLFRGITDQINLRDRQLFTDGEIFWDCFD